MEKINSLKVSSSIVSIDILNENEEKIGAIVFDPKDARIIKKLTDIIRKLTELANNVKTLKLPDDFDDMMRKSADSIEDFEKVEDGLETLCKGYDIEYEMNSYIIENLSSIFGQNTVEIFTGGTLNVERILPLMEAVMPYVNEVREERLSSYLNKKENSSVMR